MNLVKLQLNSTFNSSFMCISLRVKYLSISQVFMLCALKTPAISFLRTTSLTSYYCSWHVPYSLVFSVFILFLPDFPHTTLPSIASQIPIHFSYKTALTIDNWIKYPSCRLLWHIICSNYRAYLPVLQLAYVLVQLHAFSRKFLMRVWITLLLQSYMKYLFSSWWVLNKYL